jgi:hypothetical protein
MSSNFSMYQSVFSWPGRVRAVIDTDLPVDQAVELRIHLENQRLVRLGRLCFVRAK